MRIAIVTPWLLVLAAGAAQAAPTVLNGSFENTTLTTSSEFGASYGGQTVTDWTSPSSNAYNLYWFAQQALNHDDIRNNTRFPGEAQQLTLNFNSLSPDGGNFVAIDGDTQFNGPLQQTITGLTPGQTVKVSFYWAALQLTNRGGETTERIDVSLGGETHSTVTLTNPTQGFTGWQAATLTFTASAASELLSFLSVGTPNGLPPVALLDGVSLTVPEPASMALLGAGMLGIIGWRRRRA